MEEKEFIRPSTQAGTTGARIEQKKDWLKKLEEITGEKIDVRAPKFIGTVCLVVDCSGSMAEGNKIDQAKEGAIGFAKEALKKGYFVGLIRFGSDAEPVLEPQNGLTNFNSVVNEKIVASLGSTNMASAIYKARDMLRYCMGTNVMCIVTDGMPDSQETTIEARNGVRREGIEIMTLGVDKADKEFLEKLATRKELAVKVTLDQLGQGIISMSKLLPGN